MIPVAAAFAVFAIAAIATLFLGRSHATTGNDRIDVRRRFADRELPVPFAHLGVEVEPPDAPNWQSRAARAPAAQAVKSSQRTLVHEPLALAHVDRATRILHDHVHGEASSVAGWLMLLELYRTHGRDQAFAALAKEFAERFRVADASAPQSVRRGGPDAGLEAFPPVMKLVTMLWGTQECRGLLERLQRDRSEGRRLGLSRAAYVDIATLARLLDTLLAEIDADRAEEAKLRAAWARAGYIARA